VNLLVSCPGRYQGQGRGNGGLVAIHRGEAFLVDTEDSTGLYALHTMVFRFVRSQGVVIGYNGDGQERCQWMLPEVKNGHDVQFYQGLFMVVSTGSNEIHWYDQFGQLVRRWQAPGEGDAWHLNCLWRVTGSWYVTAFGRFDSHRAWKGRDQMAGILMALDTGKVLLDGLHEPHNPRFLDGRWVLCESATGSLVVQCHDGGRLDRVQLEGYTRGLAYDKRRLYVGESRLRNQNGWEGSVAVLDRVTCEVVDRIEIPLPEVYDVLVVSEQFIEGLFG